MKRDELRTAVRVQSTYPENNPGMLRYPAYLFNQPLDPPHFDVVHFNRSISSLRPIPLTRSLACLPACCPPDLHPAPLRLLTMMMLTMTTIRPQLLREHPSPENCNNMQHDIVTGTRCQGRRSVDHLGLRSPRNGVG